MEMAGPRVVHEPFPCGAVVRLIRTVGGVRLKADTTYKRKRLGLIRFRGHLSKGEYDVQTDGRHTEASERAASSPTSSRPAPCAWSSMRARRSAPPPATSI